MKKVFLCVGAVAIFILAAVNLNLTINRDSKVNVVLSSLLSFAENESGNGKCATVGVWQTYGCVTTMDYYCASGGTETRCRRGTEINNECPPYDMWNAWEYTYCPN